MTEDRLIRILASSYYWPGADYDDVAQEARYALERARSRWDPERGCAWLSFAFVCVRAHLIEQVRRETQRRPQFAVLSEQHAEALSLDERVYQRERLRSVLRVVRDDLTDVEREAVRHIASGGDQSEKRLDNALQRARRKLRAA